MSDKEILPIESLIAEISDSTDRDRVLERIEQNLDEGKPLDLLTFLEVLDALRADFRRRVDNMGYKR